MLDLFVGDQLRYIQWTISSTGVTAMGKQMLLETEKVGKTIILAPRDDMRELEFDQIEQEAAMVLETLDRGEVDSVVFDFERTNYYGSTALGFFVKLWKRVKAGKGQMAFCNVSSAEREVLEMTRLDSLWPICETRAEALEVIRRHREANQADH